MSAREALKAEGVRKKAARKDLVARLLLHLQKNPEATNREAAQALGVSAGMVQKHRVEPRKRVNVR